MTDARNVRIVTWTSGRLVHIPTSRLLNKVDLRDISSISVGTNYNLAPIHVGNRNVNNSGNAQILVSRNVTNVSSISEHAFSDSSNVVGGNPSMGYNSFDARLNYTGTASFDHYAGFQGSPVYASSGTMDDMYLFTSIPRSNAGTITNLFGYYVTNPLGTGTIVNNYGLYVESLNRGSSLNYAIYTAGSTPSYLGGNVAIGGNASVTGTLGATGAATLTGGVTVGSGGTAINVISNGTWTPTLNNTTNVASSASALCHYTRVGNHVWVFGAITVTPTAGAGASTLLGISLPVASNFAATTDLRGTANSTSVTSAHAGICVADTTNDRCSLAFISNTTSALTFSFTFGYEII